MNAPDQEYVPGHIPSFTLERYIAEGKRDPARWRQLNREWNDPHCRPWETQAGEARRG